MKCHLLEETKNNDRYIGKYLSAIFRHMKVHLSKHLSLKHFGGGKFPFLIMISKHPGVTQEELSQEFLIDKAVTAKAIKQLENMDYIKRIRNAEDKRSYKLFLTEKGNKLLPKIWKAIDEGHKILLKNFEDEEITQLMGYLKRIFINIRNFNHTD